MCKHVWSAVSASQVSPDRFLRPATAAEIIHGFPHTANWTNWTAFNERGFGEEVLGGGGSGDRI